MASRNGGRRGLILAGLYDWGGSRFEHGLPRPLMPVAGRPLAGYALDWLVLAGVRGTTIALKGALAEFDAALRGEGPGGRDLRYYEDWVPRGPAGCARDAGLASGADTLVVIEGSVLPMLDAEPLIERHLTAGAASTVVVTPGRHGVLEPAGIFLLERRALEAVPEVGFQDLKEGLIPRLHERGERIVTHLASAVSPRVVDAATYLAVDGWMTARALARGTPAPAGYRRAGEAWFHETARVEGDGRLVGPAILGAHAVVEAGAVVVGPATVGPWCRLGAGSAVCRSALWRRATVGAGAFVDRSIVGAGAGIAPGAWIQNRVVAEAPLGAAA